MHSFLINVTPAEVLRDIKNPPSARASVIFFAPFIDPLYEEISRENIDKLTLFYFVSWPFSDFNRLTSSSTEKDCQLLLTELGVDKANQSVIAHFVSKYYLEVYGCYYFSILFYFFWLFVPILASCFK
jgi:hypothetical protein